MYACRNYTQCFSAFIYEAIISCIFFKYSIYIHLVTSDNCCFDTLIKVRSVRYGFEKVEQFHDLSTIIRDDKRDNSIRILWWKFIEIELRILRPCEYFSSFIRGNNILIYTSKRLATGRSKLVYSALHLAREKGSRRRLAIVGIHWWKKLMASPLTRWAFSSFLSHSLSVFHSIYLYRFLFPSVSDKTAPVKLKIRAFNVCQPV